MERYRVFVNMDNDETAGSVVVTANDSCDACVKAIEYFERKGIAVMDFEVFNF